MEEFFFSCNGSPGDFAFVGFTLELVKDYGICAAEAGPFGWELDKKSSKERKKIPNLVRFAVPRHVFSEEHINYTNAAVKSLHNRRHTIPNVAINRGKDMRLRHFSSDLQPVPVNMSVSGSYLDEACSQLSRLAEATGMNPSSKEQLLNALSLSMGRTAQMLVPKEMNPSKWVSDASNDKSCFEYFVAIDNDTANAETRFLIEAQPENTRLMDQVVLKLQKSALELNERIAETNAPLCHSSG